MRKEEMINYGFGFEPNDYNAVRELQVGLRVFSRDCKALIKKVGRRANRK
jgi:hypothetical protein